MFFLDSDNFQDKELLQRLTPPNPAEEVDLQDTAGKKTVSS